MCCLFFAGFVKKKAKALSVGVNAKHSLVYSCRVPTFLSALLSSRVRINILPAPVLAAQQACQHFPPIRQISIFPKAFLQNTLRKLLFIPVDSRTLVRFMAKATFQML